MKFLVVYAHPNPQSFNHAVLEAFTKGLKDGGHTSEVVDLYTSKFDPCEKLQNRSKSGRYKDAVRLKSGKMPRIKDKHSPRMKSF